MHIANLEIKNILPITREITFAFDEKVNLFVGPNATGKSTILKAISPDVPDFGIPFAEDHKLNLIMSDDWLSGTDRDPDTNAVPRVFVPAVRELMMPSLPISKVVVSDYLANQEQDKIMSLVPFDRFNGERVYHAMKMLTEEDLRRGGNRSAIVGSIAFGCTQTICNEFLDGAKQMHLTANEERGDQEFSLSQIPVVHYAMAVRLSDGTELYVGELSSGTQGVYLWVWYLTLRIAEFYEFDSDWHTKPAVVCIDEVENHLHPAWQRRVIPALREHFPGLQIFATTHSPFVVAGLEAGQVHKLYRDALGEIAVETNTERIVGWTVEEILREFMDVSDPTDEETAKSSAILRWLRGQKPTMESAEEWRQEKIAGLRTTENLAADQRIALAWLNQHIALRGDALQWWEEKIDELEDKVSPDLESRGPIAAENERFLQQLEELLQKESESEEEDTP